MIKKYIFFIFLCLLAAPALTAGDLKQLRCQSIFDTDADVLFFKNITEHKKYPLQQTENSSAQILDSVSAILNKYPVQRGFIKNNIFFWSGGALIISDELPQTLHGVPLSGLWAMHAVIHRAAKHIGLTDKSASEFAFRAQKNVLEALDLKWSEYEKLIMPLLNTHGYSFSRSLVSKSQMIVASIEVSKKLNLDMSFDIPYLAGYLSTKKSKQIYIDRGFTAIHKLEDGRKVNLIPFLMIHEGFEKALIDELGLKEKIYLRTHQLAQRLEKEAVEAFGIKWNEYQHKIMKAEIYRVDHPAQPISRVPKDLDLTPYIDYQDWDLIQQMKAAMK